MSISPKGILAADESTNTIKRFDDINLDSNFESRRSYRELLFKTKNLNQYIVELFFMMKQLNRKQVKEQLFLVLSNNDILPGIKVDKGVIALSSGSDEKITEGLDGLSKRLIEYKSLGAKFTKWRAVINIDTKKKYPSEYCVQSNAFILARYAKIVQENEMVPIVEPEVIMDGNHTINDCLKATTLTLQHVFNQLKFQKVDLKGILLKPNMVIHGSQSSKKHLQKKLPKLL